MADNRISKNSAIAFCDLCNWAYEAWITHRCLFDDNQAPETNIGRSPCFTGRLSVITQEYALHQIAKLHDPWKHGKSINLTIGYIVEFGDWGTEERHRIDTICSRLNELHQRIKPARNKILSHNDLETVIGCVALGSFPKGDDDKYFAALQDFANEVHDRWVGGPYPFNDLAKSDVDEFLSILECVPRNQRR